MVVLLNPTQAAGLPEPAFFRQAGARVSHSRNCSIGYNKEHVNIDFACRWVIELSFIFPDDLV